MGHPTMQENDTAKLTPTFYAGKQTHFIAFFFNLYEKYHKYVR